LFGIIISPDLSLDKHISSDCSLCFYQLHQIKKSSNQSLNTESAKALTCNTVLAGSIKSFSLIKKIEVHKYNKHLFLLANGAKCFH